MNTPSWAMLYPRRRLGGWVYRWLCRRCPGCVMFSPVSLLPAHGYESRATRHGAALIRWSAAARSLLDPTELPQPWQRYSYISSSGRIKRRRCRTGIAPPHVSQYRTDASNCSKSFCIGAPGIGSTSIIPRAGRVKPREEPSGRRLLIGLNTSPPVAYC